MFCLYCTPMYAGPLELLASILACLATDQSVSGTLESWPVVAGQTMGGGSHCLLHQPCSLCHYFVLVAGQTRRGKATTDANIILRFVATCSVLVRLRHYLVLLAAVRHKALSSANVPLQDLADGSTQLHCMQILAVL